MLLLRNQPTFVKGEHTYCHRRHLSHFSNIFIGLHNLLYPRNWKPRFPLSSSAPGGTLIHGLFAALIWGGIAIATGGTGGNFERGMLEVKYSCSRTLNFFVWSVDDVSWTLIGGIG